MESAEISLVDLPVGFRFRPTEEELVNHYLKLKILGNKMVELIIPEVDVHQLPPWDLPSKINELSSINSDGDEWFFCRLQNKYPESKRTRRSNDYGSWKKTGGTRKIMTRDKMNVLGLKKILVFKRSGSPKNAQTKWVLHEYHLNADLMGNILTDQSDFVLNRLRKNPDKKVKKNSKAQKNNADASFIMPKEGTKSSCSMPDEVDNTGISIMLQQGSGSICNTPDEVNSTSCSNALVTAKNTVPEEIPKEPLEENAERPTLPLISPEWNSLECDFSATPQPPTETGEQLTHDSSYQDLESYFADYEKLEEILGMLNSY